METPEEVCIESEPAVFYTTNADRKAPSSFDRYVAIDTGNSSPKFLRCSHGVFPRSQQLARFVGIPITLSVQPFFSPDFEKEKVANVDSGATGLFQCSQCHTYVNPFFRFPPSRKFYRCNICAKETEDKYFGEDEYIEMQRGSLEFSATENEILRTPTPFSMVFCIDATKQSCGHALFADLMETIKISLLEYQRPKDVHIGFVLFDEQVHLINFKNGPDKPYVETISTTEDMFLPSPWKSYLVNVDLIKGSLETVMESIGKIFDDSNKKGKSNLADALLCSQHILQRIGGKVILLLASLSSKGGIVLTNRESMATIGTEKEKSLFQPETPYFSNFADSLRTQCISVDTFGFGLSYIDVASIGPLSQETGGTIYFYPNYRKDRDCGTFKKDLACHMRGFVANDVIIRLKSSDGISVTNVYGGAHKVSKNEWRIPSLSAYSAITFALDFQRALSNSSDIYFQVQVIYTTLDQERRVRTFNSEISTSSSVPVIFDNIDLDVTVSTFMRTGSRQIVFGGLAEVRDTIISRCAAIFLSYNTYGLSKYPPQSKAFPQSIQELPYYMSCSLKSDLFRQSQYLRIDHRMSLINYLSHAPIAEVLVWACPRLYPFKLTPKGNFPDDWLPPCVPLSVHSLSDDKVYILEAAHIAFIWIGRNVPIHVIGRLVEIDLWEKHDYDLNDEVDSFSRKIHDALSTIRRRRSRHLRLLVVKRGDANERVFLEHMRMDGILNSPSHDEFLRLVQQKAVK